VLLLVLTGVLNQELKWSWFPEAIVAWGTITLAYTTYLLGKTTREENAKLLSENKRLAEENQKIREYERELDSERRRLEEVQHWIERALEFKAKHSIVIRAQEEISAEIFVRIKELPLLLSSIPYIRMEAQKLDSELKKFSPLVEKHKKGLEELIKELADIFTKELLTAFKPSIEPLTIYIIENTCVEVLSIISDLRFELKL